MATYYDADTDNRPRRKSGELFRSAYPGFGFDDPFIYPASLAQRTPLLDDTNDRNIMENDPRRPVNSNQLDSHIQAASIQRPSSLRPLEDDKATKDRKLSQDVNETKTYPQETPQTKVSFANGGKGKIAEGKSPPRPSGPQRRPLARRQSRHFSVAEQKTIGGKACAVWRNIYTALGLRQWAVVVVLIGYTLLGGLMFSWLEKGHTRRQNDKLAKALKAERENLTDEFFAIASESWLYPDHTSQREAMIKRLKEYQYKRGLGPKAKPVWDLWDGVFFSFTVFTTIGYGHYTPVTKPGRIATIVYALIGIPLLLAILADFGRVLTRVLNRIWTFVRKGIRRVLAIRRFRKLQEAAQKAGLDLEDESEGADGIATMDEEFNFPIPLAVFLIVAWIFICAGFFLLWETRWTYFEAFYFFFISLSTVGLGDLVPDHQKYMIANFPFVLIGLSLVTLVINLIQNKIEEMKERAENMLDDQMGIDEEEAETESEGGQTDLERGEPQEEGGSTPTTPTGPRPIVPTEIAARNKKGKKKSERRVNLGLIQTFKLPKNRRRIGTQTDDSYVRDVVYREYKTGPRSGSDRYSEHSGYSVYFDALSHFE